MKPSEVNKQCQQLVGGIVVDIEYDYHNLVFNLAVLTDDGAETELSVMSDGVDDGVEVYI